MNADELTIATEYTCCRCKTVSMGHPKLLPQSWQYFGSAVACPDCKTTVALHASSTSQFDPEQEARTHEPKTTEGDPTSAIDDEPAQPKPSADGKWELTPGKHWRGTGQKNRFYKVTLTFHTDKGAVISDLIIAASNAAEAAKIIDAVDPFHSGELVSIIITPAPLDAYFTAVPHPADRPLFTR